MMTLNLDLQLIVVCYDTAERYDPLCPEQADRWAEIYRPDALLTAGNSADVLVCHHSIEARINYRLGDPKHDGLHLRTAEEIDLLLFLLTLGRWIGDRFEEFWLDPIGVTHQLPPPENYRVVVLPRVP